jgi:hypothetical protein
MTRDEKAATRRMLTKAYAFGAVAFALFILANNTFSGQTLAGALLLGMLWPLPLAVMLFGWW